MIIAWQYDCFLWVLPSIIKLTIGNKLLNNLNIHWVIVFNLSLFSTLLPTFTFGIDPEKSPVWLGIPRTPFEVSEPILFPGIVHSIILGICYSIIPGIFYFIVIPGILYPFIPGVPFLNLWVVNWKFLSEI